jgi:uncharacterized protein YjlB
MGLFEETKKLAGRLTGIGRPGARDLGKLIRPRQPRSHWFEDDGIVPNHPRWPLVHYRGAVRLAKSLDPAAIFEVLFEQNGWADSWRDGVYDYLHYHSRIHEVMGVARGSAKVQFGGTGGRIVRVKAGDVVVLPAGTGHQCLSASEDFLVVGAYPATGTYNLCRPSRQNYAKAVKSVAKVPPPRKDPVYGKDGALLAAWRRRSSARKPARKASAAKAKRKPR